MQRVLNLPQSFLISFGLHMFVLALFTMQLPSLLPEPEIQAMRVTLMTAPDVKKVIRQEMPKPVKTQQSAAPKEAPKPKTPPPPEPTPVKPDTVKATPAPEAVKKVKAPEPKPTPAPAEPPKPEPVPEARPEKLDKTPDKKNVVASKEVEAEPVEEPDDFLAALDFIEDLAAEQSALAEADEETAPSVVYDVATNMYIGRVTKIVNQNWYRPPSIYNDQHNYAIVIVSLNNNGHMKGEPYIKDSSGDRSYNTSLLRGIKKSVPFPVLDDIPVEGITLELRFGNVKEKQ